MIRVLVLYPKGEGTTFDWDYYVNTHMPLVRKSLEGALVRDEVDKPVPDAAHHGAVHMFFESVDSFGAAMGASGAEVMADVPNYTNVAPALYISEVQA
jgi:uncharacterized protein (TIGR02118 family)